MTHFLTKMTVSFGAVQNDIFFFKEYSLVIDITNNILNTLRKILYIAMDPLVSLFH